MSFDYRKLLGRIVEKMGSQSNFSKAMGLSERSMSLKLNSKVPFKQIVQDIEHLPRERSKSQ